MPAGENQFTIGEGHRWEGLAKLLEECGEVSQVIGKIIATDGEVDHWDENPLPLDIRLEDELGDLLAVATFVADRCPSVDIGRVYDQRDRKLKRFEAWHRGGPTP